ncbi:hypothetical protein NYR60_01290 [Actinobacillus genomosp. 2]|uniref:Mor transcription activator family protein n=1 Tax=Actinobacillus genomosp. 2 TaxID=230709 RepID=UPI00244167F1|nr:Mor transcription activator family protein [Actinobacillus genomosp. 2]WGE32280.1 hypothetical protein NYR60_01290 [Actinobacillus genomosp. 2]
MQDNSEFVWGEFIYGVGGAVQEAAERFAIKNSDELYSFLMERISHHCGGSSIYIPKGSSNKASARARLIAKEFNGKNHAYLAKKHGISVQWVYHIVKKSKEGHKNAVN